MVAQGASTATKQLLQNATSDAISSGAITSQVKAQLDPPRAVQPRPRAAQLPRAQRRRQPRGRLVWG